MPFHTLRLLVHLLDESVDVLLTVAKVTTLDEVLELASSEATSGVRQLERPEEVAGLLEVGADSVNLVDKILHTDNAVLAEVLLNDLVVRERNALLVDLAIATLVDELTDGLEVGVTIGNVGVNDGEHLRGGLSETEENTVVDLEETEELENLARLGGNLVDTVIDRVRPRTIELQGASQHLPLDTDNEDQLGLLRDVERTLLLAQAGKADHLALSIAVLLNVGLRALEDDGTLLLVRLFGYHS